MPILQNLGALLKLPGQLLRTKRSQNLASQLGGNLPQIDQNQISQPIQEEVGQSVLPVQTPESDFIPDLTTQVPVGQVPAEQVAQTIPRPEEGGLSAFLGQLQQLPPEQRALLGFGRTPEQEQQITAIGSALERLIPLQQQLIQAQAPDEDIQEIEGQIGGLQRELARMTEEVAPGLTRGFAQRAVSAARAPVQAELTELLFQRSALGQRRQQEISQAQAQVGGIQAELELRQAISQLAQPQALPSAVQTEIFKRILPPEIEDKPLSVSDAAKLGVPFGTTTQEAAALKITPSQASLLDPSQILNVELKLSENFQKHTKEAREAQRQQRQMEVGLEQARAGNMNAGSQAVLVTFQKILDPTSVVRESEYARSGSGLSLLGQIEGQATRLAKGGAGVTTRDLEKFVETGRKFLQGYQESVLDQARLVERQAARIPGADLANILPPEDLRLLREGVPKAEPLEAPEGLSEIDFKF